MRLFSALLLLAMVSAFRLDALPAKRALLVGISDYSASRIGPTGREPAPNRQWPNLDGPVHDVAMVQDFLVKVYEFPRTQISTLLDQDATGTAILGALKKLGCEAQSGDVVVFYFAGHGSQVANEESAELDKLDESLVPADSRRGAPDIRDKVLRDVFAAMSRRGVLVTVILDACHSGSGVRGGIDSGRVARYVAPDLRDVADASRAAELGDMLVLSAAPDVDFAYETLGNGEIYGAFSWALARAVHEAADLNEPASDTFLRVQALMRNGAPPQQPVIAGSPRARLRPLFGGCVDSATEGAKVAVDRILGDGKYQLIGGWVSGVTKDSELRIPGNEYFRLRVTKLVGADACEAEVIAMRGSDGGGPPKLAVGTLLEIARWVAPPGPPLRVWIPTIARDPLVDARRFSTYASTHSIRWISDPYVPATHGLRWRQGSWELVTNGRSKKATVEEVPQDASLFVQFPASAALAGEIGAIDGVERMSSAAMADYLLVGRWANGQLEYAWMRPMTTPSDAKDSAMPLQSRWTSGEDAALVLRDGLLRLRRVLGWLQLPSSPGDRAAYRLAIADSRNGSFIETGKPLVGEHQYRLVLKARPDADPVFARYVYVFVIDNTGSSYLLFPRSSGDAVGNRLPITEIASEPVRDPPKEIVLRDPDGFDVLPPYGLDTYVLLTTDERLPTPGSLEWSGARYTEPPGSPLEALLRMTLEGTRTSADSGSTAAHWTIERLPFRSIPPENGAQ